MESTAYGIVPSATGTSANADAIVNKASSNAHAAVDSLADTADVAVRKAKPAIEKVATLAHQAVDKVAASAAPAADWLGDQGASLAAAQKKVVSDTSAYISANPLMSVGIAALAGYLISRMTRR